MLPLVAYIVKHINQSDKAHKMIKKEVLLNNTLHDLNFSIPESSVTSGVFTARMI